MAQPTTPGEIPGQPDDATSPTGASDRTEAVAVPQQEEPARAESVDAHRRAEPAPVAEPEEEQPVAAPVAHDVDAPKRSGNRLAGTAWVLLASGVFEVVYIALLALVVLVLAGPDVVPAQLAYFASQSMLLWLPLVFFFLLFELTVLLFNRAGRFLYVVASLLVGVIVYLLTAYLIAVVPSGTGDPALLRQALVSPFFIVAGVAAREVMLWTGIAIGSRGIRVRRRNRAAKQQYEQQVSDARP